MAPVPNPELGGHSSAQLPYFVSERDAGSPALGQPQFAVWGVRGVMV